MNYRIFFFIIFVILLAFFQLHITARAIILCGVKDVLLKTDIHAVPGGVLGNFIGFTPEVVEQELFDALKSIIPNKQSAQRSTGFYSPLLCYWLTIPQSSTYVKNLALSSISKNYHLFKKRRLSIAADIAFTPEKVAQVLKPDKKLVDILRQLKFKGHFLVLCSNWNKESFQELVRVNSAVFSIFDKKYISGDFGNLTVEKPFFQKIIADLNTNANQCFLIDWRQETIIPARKAGVQIIEYSNPSLLYKQLNNLKLL